MEFWNSGEALGRVNTYLQAALVVFGILTAVIAAASFVVSHRLGTLDAQSKAKLTEAVGHIEGRTSEVRALDGRALSEAQANTIASKLRGTGPVKVLAVRHNSKESQGYSLQFEKVMESVGWKVEQFLPGDHRNVSPPVISVNEQNHSLTQFAALKSAIEVLGLPFKFDEFSGNIDHEIILDVGVVQANAYQAVIDKVQ